MEIRKIDNTPAWKKKKEIKEYISKESQLFVISDGIFKCSATIQPIPMPLDLDNGLPTIHMRLGTSDTNEETFFTHFDSCAGMNIGNLKLYQWIITTNPDLV